MPPVTPESQMSRVELPATLLRIKLLSNVLGKVEDGPSTCAPG